MKTPSPTPLIHLIALVLACLASAPENAAATTRTVSSLNDDGGTNTLRTLISASVNGDTINFSVTGTITLTNGAAPIQINNGITIMGPGSTSLTVSGNNASRVFLIASTNPVSITGLMIANGHVIGSPGGGIYNSGIATINNCTLSANTSSGGGGVFNSNTAIMTMNNCTLSANIIQSSTGGGICNYGTMTLNNCTVSANNVFNGEGGGIYNFGDATLNNCTVSSNTATDAGGIYEWGVIYGGGLVTLHNTVIAGNSTPNSPDVYGSITSQGHNLVGSASGSSGWVGSDLLNVNPLLGPLQDNGGPTFTMAPSLNPISAAIDAGDDSITNSLVTDQRGLPRKSGAHVDIGAYEVNPPNHIVTVTNDSGPGSLRQAIVDAVPLDTIMFALGGPGTIALNSGELLIAKTLTIAGPTNAGVTVSGNNASRVFHVSGGTVGLSNLTIANGNAGVSSGGGIIIESGSTLLLNNCTVSGNLATNNSGGYGGGVANYGTVLATNCTFSENHASEGGGLLNSGLYVLRNCTITSNSAVFFGGIYIMGATTVGSTIIAGNSASSGPDIAGNPVVSQGYNLIGINNGSSGITNGVNQDQAGSGSPPLNPLLGPLQNNGGPTFTHALLTGSPAIDKGKSLGLTSDQRGRARPYDFGGTGNAAGGDGSDIGAFELSLPVLNIARAANSVVLSWSASDTGFTLQGKTNINPAVTWSTVSPAPVIVSGQNTVTNSISSPPTFYRLSQ